MKIEIPEDVKFILETIANKGYEAVLVGGCIRTQLFNYFHKTDYAIKDFDIATNCPYDKLKRIFKDYSPKKVGASFGVLMIKINGYHYEIALYRKDGDYSNNRQPDSVSYVNDLYEDIIRRDFTINGIAYSLKIGLIDLVDGVTDIRNRVLRAIGNPDKRLEEDCLRLLRGVRFYTKYNLKLEYLTEMALIKYSESICSLPVERIREELNKILLCDKPSKGIRLLQRIRLLKIILPEVDMCFDFNQNNFHHDKDLFNHLMVALDNTKPILVNRLSALFHDIGKVSCMTTDDKGVSHFYQHHKISADLAFNILSRLKYDNKTIAIVKRLIYDHMQKSTKVSPKAIKKLIKRVGEDNLDNLFDLLKADIIAHKPPHNFESLDKLKTRCKEVLEKKEPTETKHLAINGHDIINLGFKKGKVIGHILNQCLELVLDKPDLNNRKDLLDYVINNF